MTLRRHLILLFISSVASVLMVSVADAATRRPVDIPERLQGAERAVVGQVVSVEPVWLRTESGDELIVSRVRVLVEETLKGLPAAEVVVEVEGGQIGELTLSVSDMPVMRAGERAVVMTERTRTGRVVPHLRGLGILKLDHTDTVPGSSLTLGLIRDMATAVR